MQNPATLGRCKYCSAEQYKYCSVELKLLETYLRSTMAQERLSGLAVISINHEVGGQIRYNDVPGKPYLHSGLDGPLVYTCIFQA